MCNKSNNSHKSNVISNLKNKVLSCISTIILSCTVLYLPSLIAIESTPSIIKRIGISQIVEHPALDAVRQSMLDSLKEEGFESGKNLNIFYENAQGNMVISTQIANKLLHADLDLVVGVSTPSIQTLFYEARKLKKKIPLVFSAVSDPKAAKLDSDAEYPITGITDTANLEGLLELINIMMPKLKTLGLMYNPAEANSVSTIDRLKKLLKERHISFMEVTVNKTQDVAQATKSLIGLVDALYFPQDNTVVAAIPTVVKVATQTSPLLPVILPIFTNDPILIKKGILAAVGYDYEDMGKETGRVVARILKGELPQKIAIHNPSELKAVINVSLANKLGLFIPKKLKHSKVQIVE